MRFNREPEFADAFYKTWQWRQCRASYLQKVGGLCERCAARGLIVPATQVHHKAYLTPDNLKDPEVALNHANLEALCKDCHQAEHKQKRWICRSDGTVTVL